MKLYNMMVATILLVFLLIFSAASFTNFLRQTVHIPLSIPHQNETSLVVDNSQLDCMVANIYWEAGSQPAMGKAMVAEVVMQRLKSPHFPDTICGIVHEGNVDGNGHIIKNQCSFSWTCDSTNHVVDFNNTIDRNVWMQSYMIAKLVMANKVKFPVDMDGVTHYHAGYVKPFWAKCKDYKMVAKVGDHLFYHWKKANIPSNTIAMN